MSVNGVGNSNAQSLYQMYRQQKRDLASMAGDVQSGDMSSAQQALTAFQSDSASLQAVSGASGSSDNNGAGSNPYASVLQTDLTNLIAAVRSGNSSDAQSALAKLGQDAQPAQSASSATGHHHGHHHAAAASATSGAQTDSDGDSDGSSAASQGAAGAPALNRQALNAILAAYDSSGSTA